MRITKFVILLTVFWPLALKASLPDTTVLLPTLPQQFLEDRFQQIQQSFEERATLFLKGKPFQPWTPNKPQHSRQNEFNQINEWRTHTWYVDPNARPLISRTDFRVAQDLLEKGLYRHPTFIAFDYNRTDGHYNSSTIVLNGFKFLALEAPTHTTLRNFFLLLQNFRVTQLICLSQSEEPEKDKSVAYWTGHLKSEPKSKETYLRIPARYNLSPYSLRYYSMNNWVQNRGTDPKELLRLILKVKKNYQPNELIACQSSHGNGRAGTFIAGFLLITEIDRQLAAGTALKSLDISIEKIVMQLSLQRPYLVKTSEQYMTLYRLVDLYIKNLI